MRKILALLLVAALALTCASSIDKTYVQFFSVTYEIKTAIVILGSAGVGALVGILLK